MEIVVKLCAVEMLEVTAHKHEGLLSFKPREFDVGSYIPFHRSYLEVAVAKMKGRDVALESHVFLG